MEVFLSPAIPVAAASPSNWICRSCSQVACAEPGSCQLCGQTLVERRPAAEGELRSLNWRLSLGVAITIALVGWSVLRLYSPSVVPDTPDNLRVVRSLQLLAATAVVFICGGPILRRGWVSFRR